MAVPPRAFVSSERRRTVGRIGSAGCGTLPYISVSKSRNSSGRRTWVQISGAVTFRPSNVVSGSSGGNWPTFDSS